MDPITITELLAGGGVTLGTIATAWIAINNKVGKMETKIDYLEQEIKEEKRENKQAYLGLTQRMDELIRLVTDVRLELSEKKNRNEN